ncbi:uncharacterized protein [Macrobrachium rosenbergii]|uniref:uncharacterized protein n=1 Tax=Macrobrachium rosenbergii TaxID=79674 RepID=UPI0034D6AEC1
METVRTVLSAIMENDFMLTVDLMDVYFQVPVHTSSRRYLRFVLDGLVYQFKDLCFGLSTTPQVFTRVFALVSVWVHSGGICLLRYLDDWLVLANSHFQLLQDKARLLELCHELGVVINFRKSDLIPKQKVQYLGMLIDTTASSLPLAGSNQHVQEGSEAVPITTGPTCSTVADHDRAPVVVGETRSVRETPHSIPPVEAEGFLGSVLEPQSLLVPISQEVRDDLAWWLDDRNLCIGTPLSSRPPDLLLFSDASKEGWGAHLEELLTTGVWDLHERHLHINVLEMKAAFLGLQCFQDRLMGHSVVLMSDNLTVVAYVNEQGGLVSWALHELTSQVRQWAVAHLLVLSASSQSCAGIDEPSNDPGSPQASGSHLVSRPAGSALRRSKGTPPPAQSALSASCRRVPPRCGFPVPSRLEVIHHLLRARGFSR